jgi:hypothetical protein
MGSPSATPPTFTAMAERTDAHAVTYVLDAHSRFADFVPFAATRRTDVNR